MCRCRGLPPRAAGNLASRHAPALRQLRSWGCALALTGGHALPGLDQHVHISLLLTLFTGLSTGIGSLQGLLNHSINTRLLSLALSFSAGG